MEAGWWSPDGASWTKWDEGVMTAESRSASRSAILVATPTPTAIGSSPKGYAISGYRRPGAVSKRMTFGGSWLRIRADSRCNETASGTPDLAFYGSRARPRSMCYAAANFLIESGVDPMASCGSAR